jgi:hypothetical protein
MQQRNHSAMTMIMVRLSISIYIFSEHKNIFYNQFLCADNAEVIFEHDTSENEDMFFDQGII